MKKILTYSMITMLAFSGGSMYAQDINDALRYSQQYNDGTARSVSMGNAMVALGGDPGALSINPASSGVYRYSELVFTPSMTFTDSKADYLGTRTSDNRSRFGVSNFGYVGSFATGRKNSGLINWNIAIAFNRINNFTSRMSATGRTAQSSWLASLAQSTAGIYGQSLDINSQRDPFAQNLPWNSILGWNTSLLDTLPDSGYDYMGATENLEGYNIVIGGELDQRFSRESTGNVSEAILNFGGNISNKLFFGVNIGIQSIWYEYNEYYSETAVNPADFNSQFRHFSHSYHQSTSGTGVNLKAGIIYLPVKGLRLGASISTPTWTYLYQKWETRMTSDFTDGYNQDLLSPLGTYNYRVNTPFRWNAGAAYTFGKIGVLSADYERVNYSKMKMFDRDDNTFIFNEENQYIANSFKASNILRAGAEIRVHPQFSIRAGYQLYNDTFRDIAAIDENTIPVYQDRKINTNIGSLGIGYASESGFFADLAYQQQMKKSDDKFYLYDDTPAQPAPEGVNKSGYWKLLISLGFRF